MFGEELGLLGASLIWLLCGRSYGPSPPIEFTGAYFVSGVGGGEDARVGHYIIRLSSRRVIRGQGAEDVGKDSVRTWREAGEGGGSRGGGRRGRRGQGGGAMAHGSKETSFSII